MSGWNKPVEKPVETKKAAKPAFKHVLIASGVVAVLGCVLLLVFSGGDEKPKASAAKDKRIRAARSAKAEDAREAEKMREYRKSLNEKLKPFIKASPTNAVELSEFGLDPDDPDNAMKTSVAQDIAGLLAIRPGEPVPEVLVFNFMFEDIGAEMAAATGQKVIVSDGGNKDFLDSLKKWKVAIKESDGEARRAAKENLVDAQLELLKGIDEGISVNDSIRAAYEYRVNAAKVRSDLISTLAELHDPGANAEDAKTLLDKANEKMEAEGLLKIDPVEVADRYEELQEEAREKAEKEGGLK